MLLGLNTKVELPSRNLQMAVYNKLKGDDLIWERVWIPDKDTILMEWACYDVKSGKKKWDFPLPIREKTYKKHMRLEMWHELPTGFILTQVCSNLVAGMVKFSSLSSKDTTKGRRNLPPLIHITIETVSAMPVSDQCPVFVSYTP